MNNSSTPAITVGLADDHTLLRDALASLINNFDGYKVICQCGNGKELIEYVGKKQAPDVVLLDLNMPIMDGYETALWLQKNAPDTNVLMLTMYDSEIILIRLLQAGVKGFLKKDIHPSELKFAIQSVLQTGYYYSHNASGKLANLFRRNDGRTLSLQNAMLSDTEIEFLKFACTDMTYKEIAQKMHLNPRSIDNLRDSLFDKIDVKSRVGLAMYSIRNGLVTF